ncbi:hypothetical protein ACQEU6_01370 [Spirillospora sp. CA-108201]
MTIIVVKMGLRARLNAPPVTSSVRSASSTPIRQEFPIEVCAASVPATPPRASAVPATCTAV